MITEQKNISEQFEQKTIPHIDLLYNFALRMTGNKNNACSLVTETYSQAFGFWKYLEEDTNHKEWLLRIIRNTFSKKYKAKLKHLELVDFKEVENEYQKIKLSLQNDPTFEQLLYDSCGDSEISKIISSLQEDFRIVVILCDIEGYTYDEIADFVDVPVGTVRSRLHRARKMLLTKLYKLANEKGYLTKRMDRK
jgi:RNA polymerase sigma-70 factor (ECF subfamily)